MNISEMENSSTLPTQTELRKSKQKQGKEHSMPKEFVKCMLSTARSEAIGDFSLTLISRIHELDVYSCDIGYGRQDQGYLASEVFKVVDDLVKEFKESVDEQNNKP